MAFNKIKAEAISDIDYTIIYPNGGTQASPATLALNTQYVSDNPFPGAQVLTKLECLYGGKWYSAEPLGAQTVAAGASCGQVDDTIVVRTAYTYLIYNSAGWVNSTCPGNVTSSALPIRVKVWKLKG